MTDTRKAVLVPWVRPPSVLWFPLTVLVVLGLGTTLAGVVYPVIVMSGLVAGDASLQWQALPFGIGMLAIGIGALQGAAALWRQRRRARVIALVVLPLFIASGVADGLVVSDGFGLRLNLFVGASLVFPVSACGVFLLPAVRGYYKRLAR